MEQLILDLGDRPAPPPEVWEALSSEEREATVALLARLIAKSVADEGRTGEVCDE